MQKLDKYSHFTLKIEQRLQEKPQLILKLSLGNNITLLAKDPEKQVILKDLTALSDKDVHD